jgi:hypothetical protein
MIIPNATCQIVAGLKGRKKSKPTGLGGSLASNLGEGVLSQTGIENGIGDLVTGRLLVNCKNKN